MVRSLQSGDALRALDGRIRVVSVKTELVQPVFNLEVAAGQSFFVGHRRVLVHDNSLVQPVTDAFDAEPDIAMTVTRSE